MYRRFTTSSQRNLGNGVEGDIQQLNLSGYGEEGKQVRHEIRNKKKETVSGMNKFKVCD